MKDYEWDSSQKAPTTPWYPKREQIENVVISEEITTIGEWMFSSCRSLISITILNNVTTIGEGAFSGCSSLTSITIPNNVTTIGEEAFKYCTSLTSIIIPENVTVIDELAFFGCSKLTSLHIPESVKEIGKRAFAGCPKLSTITVDEKNEHFKSVDNILFTKDGTKLICYAPAKTETSCVITDGVVVIADCAFWGCSHLESIRIPDSVTTIEYSASDINFLIKRLNSPETVKAIGKGAFQRCSSLTSGTIGSITWKLIKETGEITFTGEGKMKSFDSYPWDGIKDSIKKVTISEGITAIGKSAFSECSSLTSITIPNSVTTIGKYAFYECSSLTSITIPSSVMTIEGSAFFRCSSLKSVVIPNSVTTVGDDAFSCCSSLTRATLPWRFKRQKDDIFRECDDLENINWI